MQYTETTVDTLERVKRVSRPIVQSRKTIPLQKRNAKTKGVATKGFSVSDLTVLPILDHPMVSDESEIDIRELAHLIVDATRKFTGKIDDWRFSVSDSLDDLILRASDRLRTRGGVEHIEVLKDDGALRLVLKRHIGNRSTIYCIPLRPIMRLKYRHPTLFHILFSFVRSLPYINLFHTGEDRVDWLWQYLFEEEVYHKENGTTFGNADSVKFFGRYEDFFNEYETCDWKSLLAKYRPRKPLYIKIKALLLKAETIDFQVPFRIGSRDSYDSMFEHWESFLIVDNEDSEFTRSYIEMLNECSNEYDIISAYENAVVEKNNIKPFEGGTTYKLNRLQDFLSKLNELIRQL